MPADLTLKPRGYDVSIMYIYEICAAALPPVQRYVLQGHFGEDALEAAP
jgi:hypothetical protein